MHTKGHSSEVHSNDIQLAFLFVPRLGAIFCAMFAAALCLFQAGCNPGSSEAPVGEREMMAIAALVNNYYNTPPHLGTAPANQEELKAFANSSGKATLEQYKIPNADALFTSSRDNQPIVVLYGKDFEKYQTESGSIIAYETGGVDGSRLVAFKGGSIELMTDEQFYKVVPKK